MNGWTIAKYALTLAGLACVFGADRLGVRWIGYPGLGLVVVAFLLRYPQRRTQRRPTPPADPGTG